MITGAVPFVMTEDGELKLDAQGSKKKRLNNAESLINHVKESINHHPVDSSMKLQTALVQFTWIKTFANKSDSDGFSAMVDHVSKFYRIESNGPNRTYSIDRQQHPEAPAAGDEFMPDDYIRDFKGSASPLDSGFRTPLEGF
jgi:hypothetical protein